MQEHRPPPPDGASNFAYDDEDADTVVNPSANTPLGALIAERLSRRETLRGLAASAADLSDRLSRSRLGGRMIPFNLWDVMTIIARKPGDATVAT